MAAQAPLPPSIAKTGTPRPILLFDKRNGVAEITLNRPEKMNAFNRVLWKALGEALHDAVADPEVRVIILAGAGRAFSAGNDLTDFGGIVEGRAVFNALQGCDKPTIAAVHGPAMAGGFEIALLCDFIVASTEARFSAREARIGLLPPWGLVHMPRSIGERHARDIALTGRDLTAEEAYRMGLAWKIVPSANLMEEARALAALLLEAAPLPQAEIKRALRKSQSQEAVNANLAVFGRLMGSEDFREAIRAFAVKRKPVWRGK